MDNTLYRKRMVATDGLPKVSGEYVTDMGELTFNIEENRFGGLLKYNPPWYLEPIEVPGWRKIDYENPPKGEVLLLTTSKAILKGCWYQNNLVPGFGWHTEWSHWADLPEGGSYRTLLKKEEVTHYHPLPEIPNNI